MTQASRRPRRTGLVTLGIVLLVAVAAGLLVYRAQHRTGPNTAANQTGSSVSNTTSDYRGPGRATAGGSPPRAARSDVSQAHVVLTVPVAQHDLAHGVGSQFDAARCGLEGRRELVPIIKRLPRDKS